MKRGSLNSVFATRQIVIALESHENPDLVEAYEQLFVSAAQNGFTTVNLEYPSYRQDECQKIIEALQEIENNYGRNEVVSFYNNIKSSSKFNALLTLAYLHGMKPVFGDYDPNPYLRLGYYLHSHIIEFKQMNENSTPEEFFEWLCQNSDILRECNTILGRQMAIEDIYSAISAITSGGEEHRRRRIIDGDLASAQQHTHITALQEKTLFIRGSAHSLMFNGLSNGFYRVADLDDLLRLAYGYGNVATIEIEDPTKNDPNPEIPHLPDFTWNPRTQTLTNIPATTSPHPSLADPAVRIEIAQEYDLNARTDVISLIARPPIREEKGVWRVGINFEQFPDNTY